MSEKIKNEGRIKARVFISYALLVALISFILYITFGSFQRLTQSSDALARPNPRINLLHDIVISIYYAEGNIRAYTLVGNESHLDDYFDELASINEKVDSLYILAGTDSVFSQQIDSINIQLLEKTRLLEQLIRIRGLDRSSEFYERAMSEIIQAAEDETKVKEVTHTTIEDTQTVDAPPVTPEEISREKDNFFTRLRAFFSGRSDENVVSDEQIQAQDARHAQELIQQIRTDTIVTVYRDTEALIGEIETSLLSLMQSIRNRQQHVQQMENRILMQDKKVMDKILSYITELEMYETQKAMKEAEMAHDTVNRTTTRIFFMVVLSMIVLLVFSWLFVSDVNKSKYYRKQLMNERNRAENLVQVKQRFMANISHEIRTPLNSIIGFSERAKKIKLEREPKTYVNVINQSSLHLLNIVNDILDFSKIEAGKIRLENKPSDLKEIIHEVYNTLSVIAADKNLRFALNISELKNPFVVCDPLRVKQILLNIAGNAIKFTIEGDVKLTVTDSISEDNPGINKVKFSISDTGPGILPAEQDLIFDEFAQADNKATRRHGGTGLGLSISKKLAELMDGSIELYSQPGKGSIFTVFLPLPVSDFSQVVDEDRIQEFESNIKAKILVVDDDRLNRLLLKSILAQFKGITIHEAEDAASAIKLLEQKKYDLIITDIQMPEMSGIEMTRYLRADNNNLNQNIPVLACTADITPETLNEIKDARLEDYILKPYDENLLLDKISKLALKNTGKRKMAASAQKPLITNKMGTFDDNNKIENLYDLDALKVFTGNDLLSLITILETFIEDTEQNILLLKQCYDKKDYVEISKIAHKMTNMFELLKVCDATQNLKLLNKIRIKSMTHEEIGECIRKIESEAILVITNLKDEVTSHSVK
jgi:signal transduction histidine kinase/DNA-binding NarL/FixJ family response regulator